LKMYVHNSFKAFQTISSGSPWVSIFLLALLSPLYLFPSPASLWLFLLLPLFWLSCLLLKKSCIKATPLDWGILLLLGQVLLTCLIVPDVRQSLPKIIGILFSVSVFFATVSVLRTDALVRWGILAFLIGSAAFSAVAWLGMITFEKKLSVQAQGVRENLPRLQFGLPGAEEGFHPNAVGGTLVLIAPVFVTLFLFGLAARKPRLFKGAWLTPFLTAGLGMAGWTLFRTQSRGSWLGLVLGGLLIAPLLIRGRRAKTAAWISIPLILVLMVLAYSLLVVKDNAPLSSVEMMRKIGERTSIWKAGLDRIAAHPWTGIGLNRFRYDIQVGYKTAHAHNHFIHTAAELGIPGAIALASLIIGALMMFRLLWKNAVQGWKKAAVLGLIWGQTSHLLFGLTDSIPLGAKTGVFFWISLALICALYNSARRDSEIPLGAF